MIMIASTSRNNTQFIITRNGKLFFFSTTDLNWDIDDWISDILTWLNLRIVVFSKLLLKDSHLYFSRYVQQKLLFLSIILWSWAAMYSHSRITNPILYAIPSINFSWAFTKYWHFLSKSKEKNYWFNREKISCNVFFNMKKKWILLMFVP